MATDDRGSITRHLLDLQAGDLAAAQPLWERYFDQLVRLARGKLAAHRGADEDEEDAALSAFHSFCEGAAQGRFPRLNDRDDLWRLLVTITARKAWAQARRRRRQKAGGGRVILAADLIAAGGVEEAEGLEGIIGTTPTPEFAAMVAEEYRRLLDRLGDEALRQVALRRLEGDTKAEIAERLGCARRTIGRRLELIRALWAADEP